MDFSRRDVDVALIFAICCPRGDQIEDLTDVEHHAHNGSPHHEVGEDGFLSGPRYVAVHQIGAGLYAALDLPGQLEAVVDVVKQVEKRDLEGGLHEEARQVSPPQAAVLLARVIVKPRALAMLGPKLAFPLFPVGHM